MDMKIDSALIRSERRKRGWSQEHLAALAGLGVRTIQRLESSGVASSESAKSLAAVFEIPFTMLLVGQRAPRDTRMRMAAVVAAIAAVLLSSVFLVSRANAGAVAFVVVIDSEMSGRSHMDLEAVDGQPMDIRFAKELRLLLTPRILKDDSILVSAELYGWDGSEFKLGSTPKVLVRRESETRLQLYLPNGKGVMLGITPKASVIP